MRSDVGAAHSPSKTGVNALVVAARAPTRGAPTPNPAPPSPPRALNPFCLPLGQAFGDDLGRLHRRLTQVGIFGDLALDPRTFALQQFAERVQFPHQPVDL